MSTTAAGRSTTPDDHVRELSALLLARSRARGGLQTILGELEAAARTAEGVSPRMEEEYARRLSALKRAEGAVREFLARHRPPSAVVLRAEQEATGVSTEA